MEKPEKVTYLGIQLLRMIFAFNIVVDHCISNKNQNIFIYFICIVGIQYYVPTFFFISFYFSYRTYSSKNITKLKERLLRISIPYIIWPCIIWIKYNYINRNNEFGESNKYKFLFYQLIIGKPFHPIFWFQFCLLFWSIALIIIIFTFKKTYNYIMIFLFLIILYFNYFGHTKKFFNNYKKIILWSVKELFNTILYMLSGFYFGSKFILERSSSNKLKIIFLSFIGLYILKNQLIIKRLNFFINQLVIIILFLLCSIIPFDLIKNKNIIFIIKKATSFTGGIYYLHWEIKYRAMKNFFIIKKGNFISCIFIYLFCYTFCNFSYKIFKNTKLKYLFI